MNIADDRIGFDLLSAQTVGHFGLMMRELEKALLGDLNVHISPGQGIQLNFRILLVSPQANAKRSDVAKLSFFCHSPPPRWD